MLKFGKTDPDDRTYADNTYNPFIPYYMIISSCLDSCSSLMSDS